MSFTSFSAMFMGLRCMQNVYDIICPTQHGQSGYRNHSCMNGVQLVQVNKKFCELKGGNIGIVKKAQETRFGMYSKYSRYIGIAS